MAMGLNFYEKRWIMGNFKNSYRRFLLKNSNRGIPNLMKSIVFSMGTLFIVDLFFSFTGKEDFLSYFVFDRNAILSGQVWRLISFIIIPPMTHPIFVIFVLYFFWLMGSFLESYWGVLKFNIFYFSGMIFTIIGGMIIGTTTNVFLNLSIFLAFAIVNPDFEVRLFFFIPIKIKYLAIADVLLYAVLLIISPMDQKAAIVISLLNVLIFFGPTMLKGTKSFIQKKVNKMKWKKSLKDIRWR